MASINNVDTLPKSVELIAALISLFPLIPLAGEKYVKSLLNLVIQVEQSLNAEQTSSLRLPLLRFLVRFPEEAFRQIFHGFSRPHDSHAHRILLVCLGFTNVSSRMQKEIFKTRFFIHSV